MCGNIHCGQTKTNNSTCILLKIFYKIYLLEYIISCVQKFPRCICRYHFSLVWHSVNKNKIIGAPRCTEEKFRVNAVIHITLLFYNTYTYIRLLLHRTYRNTEFFCDLQFTVFCCVYAFHITFYFVIIRVTRLEQTSCDFTNTVYFEKVKNSVLKRGWCCAALTCSVSLQCKGHGTHVS